MGVESAEEPEEFASYVPGRMDMEDASVGNTLAEYQRGIGGKWRLTTAVTIATTVNDHGHVVDGFITKVALKRVAALVAHRRVCICETAATQPRVDNLQRELPGGDDGCHAESKGRPKLCPSST
ncbi:unnamed protein product [Aspergillus oryzae]|uniref:Unnamed protein product n=2 Tax=Aspergillus oryzae TaxID=5062 RepID=A0AAN4YSP9_ASPOZ|nr:unnamed protein product [Aspergillus oryzae]GMF93111.1 unnamed protein product [Aspergillus oryzae]GMG17164.1 unnamed protein product [Aspergillus oryzae]GMG36517.1 unnamed protein product [Aspergillus oryzae]GMG47032.1 unnamed protein product [Aspergillus oryzae var. brunneus]